MDAAALLRRSGSLSYGIMSAALNVSRSSSSSSVMLPRRSLLRRVDGRRVKSEGRCDPRVDMAVDESLVRGRNSFVRGRLAERATPGEGGCFGGVETLSVMAACNCRDSYPGRDRVATRGTTRCRFYRTLIGRVRTGYRAANVRVSEGCWQRLTLLKMKARAQHYKGTFF
jgi:hypothetical protein